MQFDVAVIGAGSAGLSVAAAAAQFGERVVLFEKAEMGGDCLNEGCIPSKALLAAARAAHEQRELSKFGLSPHRPEIDFAAVMEHVQGVIAKIAPHDSQQRFESLGVTVVRAAARFVSANAVQAGDTVYTARRFVIATGARPAVPSIAGLNEVSYFTTKNIFRNRVLPRHLVVIGGGPIGLELALAHRRLGAEVTVLEAQMPLAREDREMAEIVLASLRSEGIAIHAQAAITRVSPEATGAHIEVAGMPALEASHLLVATGRVPNIEGLDLERAGIAFNRRGISVDARLRSTTNPKIYAAGDVAGGLQFTHAASYHAGLVLRAILFRLPVKNNEGLMPRITFTSPELAQVGLTEDEAQNLYGKNVRVLRSPLAANDRATTERNGTGLIKIMTTRKGRIVGVSIVGDHAGEMIAMWVLALNQRLKISAIANLVLPYPTRAEAGKRAAISYYAGLAEKPFVRFIIRLLKKFG